MLAYQTNFRFYIYQRGKYETREPPLIMHYRWVHNFLLTFLHAPVSASKRNEIRKIATLFKAVVNEDHSDIEMDVTEPNSNYHYPRRNNRGVFSGRIRAHFGAR